MLLCMNVLVDSKIVAWIIMHGYVLVDSKMNVNAWIIMHGYVLVDNKIDNVWIMHGQCMVVFLWVARLLHG